VFQNLPAIDNCPGVIFQTEQPDSVLSQHTAFSLPLFKPALEQAFLEGETK